MTTYNLTVDVHDLEPTGPVPPSAEVRIWRAQPDASGPQVVSVKQKTYPAGTGPVVVSLTAGVAYWAEFTGVRGWETPFLFSGTTDTSIAERFRAGQLDPGSLAPLPASTTALALLEQATTILENVQTLAVVASADTDPCLVDLAFPVEQLDTDDDCLVDLTIGA